MFHVVILSVWSVANVQSSSRVHVGRNNSVTACTGRGCVLCVVLGQPRSVQANHVPTPPVPPRKGQSGVGAGSRSKPSSVEIPSTPAVIDQLANTLLSRLTPLVRKVAIEAVAHGDRTSDDSSTKAGDVAGVDTRVPSKKRRGRRGSRKPPVAIATGTQTGVAETVISSRDEQRKAKQLDQAVSTLLTSSASEIHEAIGRRLAAIKLSASKDPLVTAANEAAVRRLQGRANETSGDGAEGPGEGPSSTDSVERLQRILDNFIKTVGDLEAESGDVGEQPSKSDS